MYALSVLRMTRLEISTVRLLKYLFYNMLKMPCAVFGHLLAFRHNFVVKG